MKFPKNILAVSMIALWSATACATDNLKIEAPKEYLEWLENLKSEMIEKGISEKTIKKVYAQNYYHEPKAVVHDRKQLEFVLTSDEYINRVVNQVRTEKAQEYYVKLKPLWAKLEEKYTLPAEYVVAFWGIETNFGSNFGGHNVIDALTEMSYDKRRSEFFKKELFNALKIIDDYDIDFTKMDGSWAGAMGHFQFMPSTFNAYAVDFDGDKKIDIWNSFDDAAASAANYLTTIGWKKDIPWGMKVNLPWNFDYKLTGRHKDITVKTLNKIGVRTAKGKKIKLVPELKVSIITPEGKNGNAYLITDNFYKIMHWNRSENYALAVGILADYVKTSKKWQKLTQNKVQKVKTDDVLKIQSFINKLGWFKLDEDGQLGTKTRDAIKKVQKKAMLPQDGYPDYQLMRKINNYNAKKGFAIPVPERKLHKVK